ncbi:MAG: DUF1599 domain-containing protein [Bacteroidota bacterium]
MPRQQPSLASYSDVMQACQAVFQKKHKDYGTAWRILRLPAITDQIMIKAQRIRSISDKGQQRVADSLQTELIGIINYGIIALIQIRLAAHEPLQMPEADLQKHYDNVVAETMQLLEAKNHDYGEAWRAMRCSSIIDIILMKLLRIKRIEDNANQTCASEGVASNYQDIINYAVFASLKQAAPCP